MTVATVSNHFTEQERFQELGDLFKPSPQDKRFTQILSLLLVVYLVFAIVVPLLEQAEVPREVKEQIPPQLAKILLKEKQLPLPEKKPPLPEPEKVEPELKEEVKEQPPEKPPVVPQQTREAAREKAQTSGLAAMKDELFSMREAFEVKPAAQTKLEQTNTQETKVKRKLLAGAANKQSDGASAAEITQTVTSDELSTKNTQHIRLAEEEVLASEGAMAEQDALAAQAGQRSEISLRRTLESNKARLYALYNRALRKDPFLKGKVMFEIEIQPNGSVSKVVIKSSELNNAKLERQLTVILKSIKFPQEAVYIMTTIWSIDFLPS
ncbi:AgmX/PglI C-terminal domain-containing protein [Thalassotalea sp. M1531]|uniref:AgmX/PglI C-terminal domain-containing protein n=1 Tax=Thalassotalea algicola TaxID=2716224 RepID=A0A7Y0Q717_9GAMM|nr:AgmX/PglI C-terminal domain-containing protein [Thalassotalea algicola]NMP30575.1 AgmX/PglI C-terminal domain-containing protein [Thalassotalea algicola]